MPACPFELAPVSKRDANSISSCAYILGTQRCCAAPMPWQGSHKRNFPMDPSHRVLDPPESRSPFLKGYSCPAGSAVFFCESTVHAGPIWTRDEPRVMILHAYAHIATHWHRLTTPPVVLRSLPRERLAYFRYPWVADFRTPGGAAINTAARFKAMDGFDEVVDTSHAVNDVDALHLEDEALPASL